LAIGFPRPKNCLQVLVEMHLAIVAGVQALAAHYLAGVQALAAHYLAGVQALAARYLAGVQALAADLLVADSWAAKACTPALSRNPKTATTITIRPIQLRLQ
jgi:hypothetical protein